MPPQVVSMSDLVGREPMGLHELFQEINRKSWPSEVVLHPIDFFAITFSSLPAGVIKYDGEVPYFYVGGTKVRVKAPRNDLLDLSGWEPPRVRLIEMPVS